MYLFKQYLQKNKYISWWGCFCEQERHVSASYLTFFNYFAVQLKFNTYLVFIFNKMPFSIKGFWKQFRVFRKLPSHKTVIKSWWI